MLPIVVGKKPKGRFSVGSSVSRQPKIFRSCCRHESGQLEALGYTFVESDLPPIVRDWCVGDSVLCLISGEFDYFDSEA